MRDWDKNIVRGRGLFREEARALKAEEMNHRDNKIIIHKLAFETPGESFFLSLRTSRSPFEYGRKYSHSQGFIWAAAKRRQYFRVEVSAVRNIDAVNW